MSSLTDTPPTLTVPDGNVSDPYFDLAAALRFPILHTVGCVPQCWYALDYAATTRRGIAVVGEKGVGKTSGFTIALDRFDAREREREDAQPGYKRRRVLRLPNLRNADYRGTAVIVGSKLSPTFSDRLKGSRKKQDEELREEIKVLFQRTGYIAVAADEAEQLSRGALDFLRDLMADAERDDPARYLADADWALGTVGAAGIGVFLTGAGGLESRLATHEEANHRWSHILRADTLDDSQACEIYLTWMPGFRSHVERIGLGAWQAYIQDRVTQGSRVPFRLIVNHLRTYVFEMVRAVEEMRTLPQIEFDEGLFRSTLADSNWAGVAAKGLPGSPGAGSTVAVPPRTSRDR